MLIEPREFVYLEFTAGTKFSDAATTACTYAMVKDPMPVKFDFNGQHFTVTRDTYPSDLQHIYDGRLSCENNDKEPTEKAFKPVKALHRD